MVVVSTIELRSIVVLDALNCLHDFVDVAGYSPGLTNPLGNDDLGNYKELDDRDSGVEWVPNNCGYDGL